MFHKCNVRDCASSIVFDDYEGYITVPTIVYRKKMVFQWK